MSFHGHSCPSTMIICFQPQTRASGHGRGCGNAASRVIGLLPTMSAFTVKRFFYNYIYVNV